MSEIRVGIAGRIARAFLDSRLTPLAVATAILLGVYAIVATPKEEEPQIVVPMVDVMVALPGATPREVEERVTIPLEKILWEISGVEYVYATSSPGGALLIVRFRVGEKVEDALVRLYNQVYSHPEILPREATFPWIRPRSIDDVPILALTFWSTTLDHGALRRIAAIVDGEVKRLPDIAETALIGGQPREVRVLPDPDRLASRGVDPAEIVQILRGANARIPAGTLPRNGREVVVEAGAFLESARDVESLVVGVSGAGPVYLRDVATVADGPAEPENYVSFGWGAAGAGREAGASAAVPGALHPAVTLTVAKRKGTNATAIADRVLRHVEGLRGTLLPPAVEVRVTRNYGETAREKTLELIEHLLLATVSVIVLIAFFLGWREAVVVGIAVPVTLALTLLVYYAGGYTLNRVTLFALIFSIGILVDDAIVIVENIHRHFALGRRGPMAAVLATDEVGNPTILATFTVIAAILPMALVRGLMGPYMRPIPVGASVAMLISLFVAFIVSPYYAYRILRKEGHGEGGAGHPEGALDRLYRRVMNPLLRNAVVRTAFLLSVAGLLLLAFGLVAIRAVKVKMLPFDNKSEFQVVIDAPEGTTLEETAGAAQEIAEIAARIPEVTDLQVHVGTAAPFNFSGLVRHYFLRRGGNVADLQVNLLGKGERDRSSHEIALAARGPIAEAARRRGMRVKMAEIPPGPPVLATLVAEIYGPTDAERVGFARRVLDLFEGTPGIVDADWFVEETPEKLVVVPDREKAGLHGIPAARIASVVALSTGGETAGLLSDPREPEPVPIRVRLPQADRELPGLLERLRIRSGSGALVPLSEVAAAESRPADRNLYRKNLRPVVYVTGDVAGAEESPVYAMARLAGPLDALGPVPRHLGPAPDDTSRLALKWDGEWHITLEVFRDLGAAFAAVLVLIYILVVAWFQDFRVPLVIMAPIPLTLIGILPAHWAFGAFFTATSMIGVIALAGIIVRNSIILVDFIELRRSQGAPLEEAIVDAGAIRFRPMLLTAAAVVVGSFVILFDPIFQGLAITMMFGEIASTLLSRMTIPVLYYLAERGRAPRAGVA